MIDILCIHLKLNIAWRVILRVQLTPLQIKWILGSWTTAGVDVLTKKRRLEQSWGIVLWFVQQTWRRKHDQSLTMTSHREDQNFWSLCVALYANTIQYYHNTKPSNATWYLTLAIYIASFVACNYNAYCNLFQLILLGMLIDDHVQSLPQIGACSWVP